MKKTLFAILVCGVMVLGMTGCRKSKQNNLDDIHTFAGTITECEEKTMIVRPNENEEEYKSSDKFRIEYVDGFNSCKIGDKVTITYKGMINESYPAQVGTMNSGKSIDLMRTAHSYEEVGYEVIVMKPIIDTKGNDKLDSRIGLQRKVDILIKEKDSILKLIKEKLTEKTACIFVDEAQFLSKNQIDELFFITKKINIPVICYGLRTNFMAESFEGSRRLLEISDVLEELKTLCKCKEIARFAARKIDNKYVSFGNEIEIDGKNKNIDYEPLCGKCYLQKVKKIKF